MPERVGTRQEMISWGNKVARYQLFVNLAWRLLYIED